MTKTTFAALVAVLFAASIFGPTAHAADSVKSVVPTLKGLDICVAFGGAEGERVRKMARERGANPVIGCTSFTGLGVFLTAPRAGTPIQESGPGFSNYGIAYPEYVYVVVLKNGMPGQEIARAGSAMMAGSVNSGGLYKNTSPEEAAARSTHRAIGKLFDNSSWHFDAGEVIDRELRQIASPTPVVSATMSVAAQPAPTNSAAAINTRANALLAQAKQTEADAKAAKAEAKARAAAEKRLKDAEAKLTKAKADAEKK